NEYKRDPLDFVLWKRAKPGEPVLSSPWGGQRGGDAPSFLFRSALHAVRRNAICGSAVFPVPRSGTWRSR
ncbi:hypothetical protein AAFZ03_16205, partial [Klebsiella pneumoniae]